MIRELRTSGVPSENLEVLKARLGVSAVGHQRIRPAETSRGLVAIKADEWLSSVVAATVLVISRETIEAASYCMGPNSKSKDGPYPCNTGDGQYEIGGLSFDWRARMNYDSHLSEEEERLRASHGHVTRMLNQVTNTGSAYDAIHSGNRTLANSGVLPYAGMDYGPRINLDRMVDAGVDFHPAVLEALESL
jgi:hypothetical protein